MSKLTKEEYLRLLKALRDKEEDEEFVSEYISGFSWDGYMSVYDIERAFDYAYDELKQLINEHFDNPPLKFEELEKGMWIWDNKIKEYLKVYDLEPTNKRIWLGSICYMNFEENRFYRKEVKE